MTLATCSSNGPWAAAVFYAADERPVLYFKSDPKTRHISDVYENSTAAVTIQDDGQEWQSICGLQMQGTCNHVDERDSDRVSRLFLQKFQAVARATEHPADENERILAERLHKTPFFAFRPRWIRYIDNRRSFGHKTEIVLDN